MRAGPINWLGGEHEFALRLGELRALQGNCDAGPEEVFNRLHTGQWRVDDIVEPIRLGLIGSGEMTTAEAGPFVTGLMQRHPLIGFKMTAIEVLFRALMGPEDDVPEKPEGVETPAPESGAGAGSTETAR